MSCGIALMERSMIEASPPVTWDRRSWLRAAVAMGMSGSMFARSQTAANLKVGFIANYEPFSFLARDGTLRGFDVEVMEILLSSLGMTLQTQHGSYDQLRERLRSGHIDLVGNQLLQTPEHRAWFDFVRPYAFIQLSCIQHEDDDRDFLSLDDFIGKRLGLLRHSGMEEQARGALGPAVVAYARIDQALQALSQKRLDAVLEENLIADYLIERDDLPLKVGAPFTAPQKLGLIVVKGRRSLQLTLSRGVENLVKQAAFRQISGRWFGYDVSKPRFAHSSADSH